MASYLERSLRIPKRGKSPRGSEYDAMVFQKAEGLGDPVMEEPFLISG
jgi:hypothetical protein